MPEKGTCVSVGPLSHNEITISCTNLLLLHYLNGLAFHCCMKKIIERKEETEAKALL